jgi:hypothetical protein
MDEKESLKILLEIRSLQGAHNERLNSLEKDLSNHKTRNEQISTDLQDLIKDMNGNLKILEYQAQKWKWGFAGIMGFGAFGATLAKLWNDIFKHVIN